MGILIRLLAGGGFWGLKRNLHGLGYKSSVLGNGVRNFERAKGITEIF